MPKTSVRLPNYILPKKYEIKLQPDLAAFVFEGEETIELELKKPTSAITLHAKELEITAAEFLHYSAAPLSRFARQLPLAGEKNNQHAVWAPQVRYNPKAETATFVFPKQLPKGKGKLKLTFRGVLNDQLRGFYRSKYVHQGKEKYLATTQFEATDARRAFPCFDEPDKKAVFEVTLIVPSGHMPISNTLPIDIREHESGYQVVRFAPTPVMSTYLLAFITGEFEWIEQKTKSGVVVRIYVTPGKKHQARFALSTGVKVLEFYEKYFGIKYPLTTLDMVAIPDFAAGAMENWGAVTYRESALLVDPEQSSALNKQWVAVVIAHELAHQWFGNLVTMEWWTHLWLNEGFASYIEYLAIDKLYPEWDMWTQFQTMDFAPALAKDALKDTHPIEVEVHHPDEIGEIFDDISYRKGSSVIRMLASYLGETDFREGLRHYLKKHAYKNATTKDLWAAFEKVSGKPVKKLMHAWTTKTGHPLLTVKASNGSLALSQERFFASPEVKQKDKTIWPIPITYGLTGTRTGQLLLSRKTATVKNTTGKFPKFNLGETGFYRVAYPGEALRQFMPDIQTRKLSTLDRLGLISNVFALIEAGKKPTTDLLDIAPSFIKETNYSVWLELLSSLAFIGKLFYHEPWSKDFREFGQSIVAYQAGQLGWKEKPHEPHTTKLLRVALLQSLGGFGHEQTLRTAKKMFYSKKPIPANMRGLVYTLTAISGGDREFEKLKLMYSKATLSEEQNRIGSALAQFRKQSLVKKALEFSVSSQVRTQDALRFNGSAAANPIGAVVNWEFIKRNWAWYLEQYGQGGHLLSRIVESLGSLKTIAHAREVDRYFAARATPGATRTVKQVVESIRTNALWKERDAGKIKEFLGSRER